MFVAPTLLLCPCLLINHLLFSSHHSSSLFLFAKFCIILVGSRPFFVCVNYFCFCFWIYYCLHLWCRMFLSPPGGILIYSNLLFWFLLLYLSKNSLVLHLQMYKNLCQWSYSSREGRSQIVPVNLLVHRHTITDVCQFHVVFIVLFGCRQMFVTKESLLFIVAEDGSTPALLFMKYSFFV